MKVDSMPVHKQSVEWCVLGVTAASKPLSGYAGRRLHQGQAGSQGVDSQLHEVQERPC